MPMSEQQLKHQQRAIRTYQARYDDVLRTVGRRAPEPILGQSLEDYRRETLRMMKQTFLPRNHELFPIQMRGLQNDALPEIERQLLTAVPEAFTNPANVPRGEMRKVEQIDEYGQVKTIRFVGQDCFVKEMGRPGRRVISFNTSNGPVDAGGRFLR